MIGNGRGEFIAADCVSGGADGKVYASFVGFPTSGGAGSSFTLYESMAISVSCQAKEGAWDFVRRQLLPYSNVTGYWAANGQPVAFGGFATAEAPDSGGETAAC